jgi:hypothetical protein
MSYVWWLLRKDLKHLASRIAMIIDNEIEWVYRNVNFSNTHNNVGDEDEVESWSVSLISLYNNKYLIYVTHRQYSAKLQDYN